VSLALWGGATLFFSFFTAPRIFGHLRDQLPANPPAGVQGITPKIGRRLAGDVVGSIFPVYFGWQVVVGVLAAASGLMLASSRGRLERIRCGLAAAALAIVIVHVATVYPRSVQVLERSYHAQATGDSAQAEQLRETFGMWHGISQALNLLTIVLVLAAVVCAGLALRDAR
jgi:hypothetical protein